jgi:hypothetical protein
MIGQACLFVEKWSLATPVEMILSRDAPSYLKRLNVYKK